MRDENTRPQPSAEPVAVWREAYTRFNATIAMTNEDGNQAAAAVIASALEAARREALEQAEWVPLSQDDAETELWLCLRNMLHPTDDKCLIAEMRKRGLWVYARADRASDEDGENPNG